MFSAVIATLAIVLTILITIATMSYGGNVFGQGKMNTDAARIINQAAQWKTALDIYVTNNNGQPPSDLNTLLTPQYLAEKPGLDWTVDNTNSQITLTNVDPNVCAAVNVKMGLPATVPACTDPSVQGRISCCT